MGLYHYDSFMTVPKYAHVPTGFAEESALKRVIEHMNRDKSKMWNSIELHSLYGEVGSKLPCLDN